MHGYSIKMFESHVLMCHACATKYNLIDVYNNSDLRALSGFDTSCEICGKLNGGADIKLYIVCDFTTKSGKLIFRYCSFSDPECVITITLSETELNKKLIEILGDGVLLKRNRHFGYIPFKDVQLKCI